MSETLNPATMFMHCAMCLDETPHDQTPAEYARIAVGLSDNGDFVIWCVRHDVEVQIFEQGKVDEALAEVMGVSCGGCGCKHGDKKESGH